MQINLFKALIISILSCLLSGCFLLSAKRYNSALLLNMNPDVKLEKNTLENLFLASKKIPNFSIITPIHLDHKFPNWKKHFCY